MARRELDRPRPTPCSTLPAPSFPNYAHRTARLLLRLILVASIVGGMIPVWFQLTHRWMQFAVSFVAGVMLGIGVLHMLPHAITDAAAAANAMAAAAPAASAPASSTAINADAVQWIAISLLAGMLAMFFIERFFSFHHHDVPEDVGARSRRS